MALAAPATAAWESHVSLIQRDGRTVAVLKVFRGRPEALLNEITALAVVRSLRLTEVHAPRTFSVGTARLGSPLRVLADGRAR